MAQTVVPGRNTIMLSIAMGVAESALGEGDVATVYYGAHSGDHHIYPDCRPEFADALAAAFMLCDWKHIDLSRPFIQLTKTEVAALGKELGVPFEETWSCYKGGEVHCGKCGTCVERKEALAGFDPTKYAG